MPSFLSKKTLIVFSLFALFGIFLFLYLTFRNKEKPVPQVVKVEVVSPVHTVIGKSVQGRDIDAYTYGTGKIHLVFVGGVHGGYEWNSVLVAYKFKDYLDANPNVVPENLTVTVIPSANPDGLYKIVGKEGRFDATDIQKGLDTSSGRFNANGIDLNRNFDCKWQPKSTWRNKTVSAGTKPFSEPEAMAIRDFAFNKKPEAFIFWHSQSGAVYASQCEKGILPETLKIMDTYAKASGYKSVPTFDAYETTGDSEAWLAKVGIPAITVELTTHEDVEWEKNLAGIKSIFEYYR
jgi:g-D-glutamyl-meso-diaminopimelate peptidase